MDPSATNRRKRVVKPKSSQSREGRDAAPERKNYRRPEPTAWHRDIGYRIQCLRELDDLTQSEWAAILKIDRSTLSRAEKGHPLGIDQLVRISVATGVSLDFLLIGLFQGMAKHKAALLRARFPALVDKRRPLSPDDQTAIDNLRYAEGSLPRDT